MKTASLLAAASVLACTQAAAAQTPSSRPLSMGGLHGEMLSPAAASKAAVLIIPGSGPTDRDGNNPLGVKANSYRLLAEQLATKGVATVRIDKRGLGGSRAVGSGNRVTVAEYVTDTRAWIAAARSATGSRCVWLAGHSEGGPIALASA